MTTQSPPKLLHVITAMFLIGGACIGGGMLALPVQSGVAGFTPSITAMTLAWFFMTATGLLFVEITLSFDEEVHILTMATRFFGRGGNLLAWLVFAFISYGSLVGYTAGGGITIASVAERAFGAALSKELSCTLFLLLFGLFFGAGSRLVGRVNGILFTAMIVAYFALVGTGSTEVEAKHLEFANWRKAWVALPILLTAFSCQAFLVPSMATHLKRHAPSMRAAIVGGMAIALIVYVMWQWLILGAVPVASLDLALENGEPATEYLRQEVSSEWVSRIAEFFAFFALVTSFLGIGLGLYDFLADTFGWHQRGWQPVALTALTIVPTLLFALYLEGIFIKAFDLTGGFGDTILNGVMPVMMAWSLRHKINPGGERSLPGGRPMLVLTALFFLAILILETLSLSGFLVLDY